MRNRTQDGRRGELSSPAVSPSPSCAAGVYHARCVYHFVSPVPVGEGLAPPAYPPSTVRRGRCPHRPAYLPSPRPQGTRWEGFSGGAGPVSLRLGHGAGLTAHRAVIQHCTAAYAMRPSSPRLVGGGDHERQAYIGTSSEGIVARKTDLNHKESRMAFYQTAAAQNIYLYPTTSKTDGTIQK